MNTTMAVIVVVLIYLANSLKILKEYERGVIYRLGRLLKKPKGPGIIFVFPPIDKMVKLSLRTVTLEHGRLIEDRPNVGEQPATHVPSAPAGPDAPASDTPGPIEAATEAP